MDTMIGRYHEPRCPNCGSKNCIGRNDSLYPSANPSCPFDGPEDRAEVVATFGFFDLSYNVVTVKCSECGCKAGYEGAWYPNGFEDFEYSVNKFFKSKGWAMIDGFPVCFLCREF